ncbi:MAG: LD-carboxypeptidase [Thermoanaerobaculales bacterium]|nr:LD-carboxypeptidase [Thermoanaerobaculales bacterium]
MGALKAWSRLERDEPIGVVALSGPVDPVRLAEGLDVLRGWGRPVELAPNLNSRTGYLAGDDEARLGGLVDLLDRGVRTFVAARGGYGVTRLLDRLPWERLATDGIRLVGYSDLTALLGPLAVRTPQVHGPMVAAGLARPENDRRVRLLLDGELCGGTLFEIPARGVLRHGRAEGRAVGGNLTLIAATLGTRWAPDLDGAVLFLEEVGEPSYRLDRLLTQLRGAPGFDRVRGIVCGELHRSRPRAECAKRWAELLLEATGDAIPVVVGLPFGHGARNLAFPLGVGVTVDTRRGAVIWSP